MNILALDLSLTSTGYAWSSPQESRVGRLAPAEKGMNRLSWIRDHVLRLATGAGLVVIEGYSFASRGRAMISLGELGGVVRLALFDRDTPYVDIPPTVRAKYATGKGNASKEAVLVNAVRRLGYEGSSNDEADALWLRTMAEDHYGLTESPVPKSHREALDKIQWPERGEP